MLKAKRNDPCPCGSGKKYKKCCLRQDRVSTSRERNSTDLEAALLNVMRDYAYSPRFSRVTPRATLTCGNSSMACFMARTITTE